MSFGFTLDYFLHFGFVNNSTSLVYTVVFLSLMFFSGGWLFFLASSAIALVIATITQHFLLNRRITNFPTNSLCIITGCSTGLGRAACFEILKHNNIHVLATVRKESDRNSLLEEYEALRKQQQQQKQNSTPIGTLHIALVDVAIDAEVVAFGTFVKDLCDSQNLVIAALYNNAGYAVSSMVEYVNRELFDKQFNPNVYGLIHVTNQILPLMRKYNIFTATNGAIRPKVIAISSVVGKISTANYGLYAASKHCIEALYDALRVEVAQQNIQVVLIEPGGVYTNFLERLKQESVLNDVTTVEAQMKQYPLIEPEVHNYYTAVLSTFSCAVSDLFHLSTPVKVGADLYNFVLQSANPLPRYAVGRDAHAGFAAIRHTQQHVIDVVQYLIKPLKSFAKSDTTAEKKD